MYFPLLIFCSLASVLGAQSSFPPFDFVEDYLKQYVNKLADPCEDFYRHACPIGIGNNPDFAFEELRQYINNEQKDAFWKHLQLKDARETIESFLPSPFSKSPLSLQKTLGAVGREICETDSDIRSFTDKVIEILNTNLDFDELQAQQASIIELEALLSIDENGTTVDCEKIRKALDAVLASAENRKTVNLNDCIVNFERVFYPSIDTINTIGAHLQVDIRRGIEETRDILEKMAVIANEWVRHTPWALRNNVTEQIEKIASALHVHDTYGKDLLDAANILGEAEETFTSCLLEFGHLENGTLFCYVYTASSKIRSEVYGGFTVWDNAFNGNHTLIIGLPNYYHQQYGKEMASKLGYTGFTVGHEMGHTFIDDHNNPEYLPFFSQEAQDCILDQYNKTCMEFREVSTLSQTDQTVVFQHSCFTTLPMFDDDGADIFGMQLAYELLVDYYGDDLTKFNERLNVTNEQLFFYSFAFQFCNNAPVENRDEKHAAENVRVNVVAQHPGFQSAFECSSDSRMMRSVNKQCFIYGEYAPERKRRHRRFTN